MENTDEALGKLGDDLVENHRDDTDNEVGKEVCKADVEVMGKDPFLSAGAISSLLTSARDHHCCNHIRDILLTSCGWAGINSGPTMLVRPDETACILRLIILYDKY